MRWILAFVVVAALALLAWFVYLPAPPRPPIPAVPPAGAAPGRRPGVIEPGTFVQAGAALPTVEAPESTVPVVGDMVVTGRVVDERRFPVAGASVSLHGTNAPVLQATAGEDGKFRIAGVTRPGKEWIQPGILARAPDGRIGVSQVGLSAKSPAEVDAGVVVMGAAAPLSVRVLDGAAPVAGARVFAGWGYSWPLDAVTGADGIARFEALPKQAVSLLATAADPARAGRADTMLPSAPPQPVDIVLAAARTVEVTVFEKGTEKGIPGATFRIQLQRRSPGMVMNTDPGPLPPVAPTDAEGKTRIEGTCAADFLSLEGTAAPGFFPSGFRQGMTVKPGETQVRIELVGGRPLRFPVVAGEAPVPADGTVITLSPAPGSGGPDPVGGARMEGSDLVVETATQGYYMAMAAAPDGARAALWADDKGTAPKEVSFRPARTVEVVAKKPDGSPAAGIAFSLRNQGNNPLGDPRTTGEDGRVVFDGLYGQLTEVYLLDDPTQVYSGRQVGSVDLAKGGGTVEVVLPGKRTFVAKVTVDGTPRLVPQMGLTAANTWHSRFEEDPAKGEIRFEMAVPAETKSVTLSLQALPYLPATATVPIPETGPIPVEFALKSGGVLLVEVKAPKDALGYRLSLQRWDAEKGAWMAAMVPGSMVMGIAPGPDGVARAEPLVEGRYRVVESSTGIATEPVEVRIGGEPARLSLDVSRQGYAKGKVLLPEGAKTTDVRILVKGQGIEPKPPTGGFDNPAPRIGPDGAFMVRVPGDRPVTVIPWHPALVPAPDGTAEVTEPREDLVLRLVQGARALFRLNPGVRLPERSLQSPRVLLFSGEPAGEPVSEHVLFQDGDALAFGGFKAGTYTAWIDMLQGSAPAVVRGVVLGGEDVDLGTVATSEGSHVRVKILVKEGTAVPRIAVWANREEAPKYSRLTNSNGEETVVIGGLGPGRFRITVMQNMGTMGKPPINEVHELDGTNDIELTLDLR